MFNRWTVHCDWDVNGLRWNGRAINNESLDGRNEREGERGKEKRKKKGREKRNKTQ